MENKIKKEREVVTKDNYKQVVLKRAIILCWVLLGVCFVVKIFGGNFFNIVCNNGKFISVCDFIENSIIKYIIYLTSFIISSYLVVKIVNPNLKLLSLKSLLFILLCVIVWVFKLLLELDIIKLNTLFINMFDLIVLYALLIIFTRKPIKSLFAVVLLFLFTFISSFVKGIGINNSITDRYIIAQIFFIDYYIMLTLSVLYQKKYKKKEN